MNLVIPQCFGCKNFIEGGYTCAAFPDGIDNEILTNKHDHSEPFGNEKTRDGKPILLEPIKSE